MIWVGDFKWENIRKDCLTNLRMFLAEIKGGLDSGIPICCTMYYCVGFRLHMLLKSTNVLNILFPDGPEFFKKHHYHRCIVCFWRDIKSIVLWNGVNEWTAYYSDKSGFKMMKDIICTLR